MFTRPASQIFGKLLAGLLWLSVTGSFAQEMNSSWLVRSWQSDDGLPNNSVEGLAQTREGYLWIGSPAGLARFDGLRFESFSLTNLVVLPNRGVITMLRGRDGRLWLAMDRGGVVCLDGHSSRTFTQGLPNKIPSGLAEDAAGGVWIAYRDGSVYRLKSGEVTQFTSQQGLPDGNNACALETDNHGQLWFAKSGQVGQFLDGSFKTLWQLNAKPVRLGAARAGGVWLCCGNRLYKCETAGALKDFGTLESTSTGMAVTCLLEDRTGAVWVGTSFGGLYRHDETGFAVVPTTSQQIRTILEDAEGSIWVGTYGGGLNRIRPRAIKLLGVESGLPFPSLLSICEATDGSLWAVTQNGVLVHQVNGSWVEIPVPGDPLARAIAVAADGRKRIWIGTRRGIYCWSEGRFVAWGDSAAVQEKVFHTVLAGKSDDVWFGQEAPPAILRLRHGALKTFALPPDSRNIRGMTADAAGNIWVATSKGALFRVSGEQLTDMTPNRSREIAPIRCLAATADGAVWIGFAGSGLGCFKAGRYQEFNHKQGLQDNFISQIVADDLGWLWFGSDRGLFKVRQRDFWDVSAGKNLQVRPVHYGRSEGLPSLQATFGSAPNVLRSHDGRLWFPMQTALVVVDPEQLNVEPSPPPILLSRATVDGRVVAQYGGILSDQLAAESGAINLAAAQSRLKLPPEHRRMEVEFAALSFYAPENVRFRYRLKGFETDWVDAGTRRSAVYSRLPSGEYFFEMTARNSDGDWNKSSATLDLVVAPFYWQTWWFRLLAVAAFTASIIGVVRYVSFRRLQKQLHVLEQQAALQRERARIAKDIHDDLGAGLTQIAYLGELANLNREEPDKVSERIGKMSATARQAVKSLDEIVWAVNPRNDTLAHLIDYTNQFAFEYLRTADIRVRLDFPGQIPARQLSADVRHNIFLTIKEALHNIVKHAGATEVRLIIRITESVLEINVEDNGRGFASAPDDALADGLRNMRQRLADVGGECRSESQPGRGTKVLLRLPWSELRKK